MSSVRLKQLAQDGANNGDVVTYNSGTGVWEPGAGGGGGTPAPISALSYTFDSDTAVSVAPALGGFKLSAQPTGTVTEAHFDAQNDTTGGDHSWGTNWIDRLKRYDRIKIASVDSPEQFWIGEVDRVRGDLAGRRILFTQNLVSSPVAFVNGNRYEVTWIPWSKQDTTAILETLKYDDTSNDVTTDPGKGWWRFNNGTITEGGGGREVAINFTANSFGNPDAAAEIDNYEAVWKDVQIGDRIICESARVEDDYDINRAVLEVTSIVSRTAVWGRFGVTVVQDATNPFSNAEFYRLRVVRSSVEDKISTNLPGEIAAIPEKTSPAGTDLLVIEDSADSNNKKRLQISNLPTGGGGGGGDSFNAIGTVTAATLTVNFDNGTIQTATIEPTGGTVAITLQTTDAAGRYVLILNQGATANDNITWTTAVKWPKGQAPDLSGIANTIDLYTFIYDGTDWWGTYSRDMS